ncbi:MAG: dicarboxylate/amino acid:cation symporter [Ignavibacteriae bacterium]|nr:MAG: dicarboxylate/amino acid:cation symporter [Ignavibacteriota bacterium]
MALHWQIFIGLILGLLFGLTFGKAVDYIAWIGTLFIQALKMIIIPLIFTSIISGVTNIGSGNNFGRLFGKTFSYYIVTSLFAISAGLLFVNIIQPGVGAEISLAAKVEEIDGATGSFTTTLMKIIPTNVFQAMASGNMLSIIFFAMLIGFFITKVESKHKNLLIDFFNAGFDVMMKVTMFIIKFTPIGVFALVAKLMASQEHPFGTIQSLGLYMITVVLALLFHAVIVLPSIVKFIGNISPVKHFKALTGPLLTAFSTSSSNATLPFTIEAVEDNSGVSNKITSFTLPLGATINMDGTALYEGVAVMFIAQAYGIELGILQQVIVLITALLASIGAAAIPMAGLVMMTIILTAVGLPLEGIALILPVDRILDMCRTMVNVWSDSCGAVLIAKSEGEELKV